MITKFGDLSISVGYISPAASTEELRTTLDTARKQSQPKAIIMGDINAQNTQWDRSTNTKGSEVLKWAEKHGWTINASASPSFTSVRGTSNVDLMICRNVQFDSLPSIPGGDWIGISDHKPVIAEVHGTAPDATPTTRVPWWKRNKPEITEKAKYRAEELVPHLIDLMEHVETTVQLEDLYKRWEDIVTRPYTITSIPRPRCFKPFWDHRLDQMGKKRSRLYKKACQTGSDEDWSRYESLNKRIKTMV